MNFVNFREIKAHYNTDSSENSSVSYTSDSNSESNRAVIHLIETNNMHNQTETVELAEGANQQSRRSSVSSNNSYFPVRNSLSLIPVFNGKNIPVTQFTGDCKGVFELVEPDDRLFFFRAVLQTKLTGNAALVRSIYTIDSLDDLCSALEKEFGKSQSFDHWEVEINKFRQRRDESIENYATRARKLNSNMIVAISNYPDQTARAGLKVFATNKLIDHFLGGLHSQAAQLLLTQKFDKLEDAIESAIKYINKSQYHTERFRHNKFNNTRITCNYCKKIGHTESEYRTKFYNSQNNQYTPREHSNLRHNQFSDTRREQNFSRNSSSGNNNLNRFNNDRSFSNNYQSNQPNFQRNNYPSNSSNNNPHLNYQGQTKSVQRSGQISSRAHPIQLLDKEQEHIQSEQPRETSSASHSQSLEIQEIDSC